MTRSCVLYPNLADSASNGNRAIFQAASHAQKAVQYLHEVGVEPDIEANQNATRDESRVNEI